MTTPRTSQFYHLPKIHKPNHPGRPIVSACSCPTENISAYLDEVMAPLVRGLSSYVKDTNHALQIFDSFHFDPGNDKRCFIFTMDIKSLYTVIPNDCGLKALAHFLDKRPVLQPATSTLTRLAELVLTLNTFSFNGAFYRQVAGVAMGSKMGPNYACLFVGYMEEAILSQYTGFIPQLYKRYIDDVVGAACCDRKDLEDFIAHVSNFHPSLQYTHTISETSLPFLDINLHIAGNSLQTSAYYKETDTHSYLHHQSSHPQHSKNSLPYSQLLRLRRLCSDENDFSTKAKEMCGFFRERGYPSDSLREDLRKISNINRMDAIYSHRDENNQAGRVPLVLTYHPLNEQIKKILLGNFRILNNDPETGRIFTDAPLLAHRRDRNIRNILVHTTVGNQSTDPAGTFPCNHPRCRTCQHVSPLLTVDGTKCSINIKEHFSCDSSNLIYCISCRKCSALYIGETGRNLRERFGEHLRSIEKNSPGFPVAEHFNGLNHSLSDAEIRGIKLCSGNNIFRKRLEMRLIFKLGTTRPRGMNINFTFI